MPMDNGRDLAEMLCTAYESDASVDDPNEHYDFSASNGRTNDRYTACAAACGGVDDQQHEGLLHAPLCLQLLSPAKRT